MVVYFLCNVTKTKMKKLTICVFLIVLYGCKSRYAYEHPVKLIYDAPYDKQVISTFPFLEKPEAAKTLGIALFSIYYSNLNIDFNTYDSINASLVNKKDIWKVKIIRHEIIDNRQEEVHYLVYIRKIDGALLYTRREAGEWIGSTDLEEMPTRKD